MSKRSVNWKLIFGHFSFVPFCTKTIKDDMGGY